MPFRLILSLAVLTLTSSCAELLDLLRASSAGHEPTFTFVRADVRDATLESLTLDTVWRLDNPNDLAISLAQVDYALFIEGKQVVAGSPAAGLQVAARGSTELHFPANVKFVDLAAVVQTFLTKDTAAWRVQGSLGVSTPIGVVSLPLATSGQFEVPKVPAVQFGNPRVSNVSFAGATIEFPLQITNKNSYALPISSVTGALSIAGAPVGTLSSGDLGAMTGRGTRTVTLPLTVNFLSAAGALVNVAQGGNAQVRFDAQVQSGRATIPVKVDQLLNFVR
jgi:LEA14-like dessication related protein